MTSRVAQSPPAGPAGPATPQTTEHDYVQDTAAPVGTGEGEDVEVDDETESSYESGPSTRTTSIASSVFSFVYVNGRRYHSESYKGYFMPNDEGEQDRLDLYHHMFLLLLGGDLYTAPLDKPQRVLDVGTGTGIWAIDFADLHPEAEVIGTDISPIQPSWVPPNAKFEIDDMELEWTFPDNHFDYIHIRSLSGSFKDWDTVLKQAFEKTAPGGYVEFQDYGCEVFKSDGTRLIGINDKHPISSYIYYITSAAERAGRPLNVARGIAERLEQQGFVDVQEKTVIWPMGTWPKQKALKEIGRWGKLGTTEAAYPFALLLLTREGWTKEQVKEMVDATIADMHTGKYYYQGWFVYGRKPEGEEE